MINVRDINELIRLLQEKSFWIYGTGFVANVLWQSLNQHNLCRNVRGFIVSKKKSEAFYGINVKGIDEVICGKNDLICIAVHESNADEVIGQLENRGWNNYIFMYPYLWDLKLGEAIKRDVRSRVNELIRRNLSDYKIVVRYLALEQYLGKNKVGYDLYIKAFGSHVDTKTAVKRLNAYMDFISQWEKGSCVIRENIKINKNNQIIDGHHRIVLAKYFGLKTVKCDIYDTEEAARDIYGIDGAMTTEAVRKIFDIDQIEILEQCRKKLILESEDNDGYIYNNSGI